MSSDEFTAMLKKKQVKMEKKNQKMCDKQMKYAPQLCTDAFDFSKEECGQAVPAYTTKCF